LAKERDRHSRAPGSALFLCAGAGGHIQSGSGGMGGTGGGGGPRSNP